MEKSKEKKEKKENKHKQHKKRNKPDKLKLIRQTSIKNLEKNNECFFGKPGKYLFQTILGSF